MVKAVYLDRHGPPQASTYDATPDRVAGPSRIVVTPHAVGGNGVDWRVRTGDER